MERHIHLRVKVKSLVEESRIIRSEARKASGMVKWGLNHHRKTVVRRYTRLNLLAYGCLRGVPYKAIERHCRSLPDFSRVAAIAKRFGGDEAAIEAWVRDATEKVEMEAA